MCLHTYFQSDSFIKYTRECVCLAHVLTDVCV